MSRPNRPTCAAAPALLVAALGALAPSRAAADAEATFTYEHDIVWSTAVRLLRVDLGYEIAEQDRENGYLLFVIRENGREYRGAVEFVRGSGERGLPVVELRVRVTGQPRSTEETILRRLRTKLRDDYGLPPRPPAAPPPPPEQPPAPETSPPAGAAG